MFSSGAYISSFLSSVFSSYFSIQIPGFNLTFGQLYLGSFAVCFCIALIKFYFAFSSSSHKTSRSGYGKKYEKKEGTSDV